MAITPGDPSAVPYEIAAPFLRALIYYLATSAEFWQRGGDVLRHELISDPIPKLLAQAVRAVVVDNKEHPGATGMVLVIQRLHTWSLEQFDRPSDPEAQMAFTTGPKNITKEALARCHDYLLEVDPAVFPPMEQVLKEMLPTIKRQLNQEAAKAVLRGLSPLEVEDAVRNNQRAQGLLQRVQAVGQPVAVARGLDLDEGWLDGVAAINAVQRFSYGIPELDVLFHGGPPRGELGFVVGAPGEGKSFWLVHTWVQMLLARTNVRYATLELSANRIRLRAASNLTGIPMQAIQGQPAAFREAQTRLRWLRENGFLGNGSVKMFPSGVTKLSDIIKWVLDEEQRIGAFIHGVLIDADEHLEVENDQWTDYKGMGKVYAGASAFAQGPDPDKFPELTRWVLFASQAKNLTAKRDDYIKRVEDAADSMRKSRVVDWGITLNVRQPPGLPKTMCLNLGKNRNHDVGVLPDLPTNYACAQPVAVQRAFPWHREPTVWKQMTQVMLIG